VPLYPLRIADLRLVNATMTELIYKIVPRALWQAAEATGVFDGAPIDHADGYIHFSTATQAAETAAKHFTGQDDLLLVAVEADRLGDALRYEVSRGGALFPHLYASLPVDTVLFVKPLPLGSDGKHQFPEMPA
jgi:uncharacterized protein (DUF952 family)